jgi:hypothetical protein
MRTNVLKREEKGIGPVSFPRVLLSGLGGAFGIFAFSRITGNFFAGCFAGLILGTGIILLTQPVQGTPMGQFLLKTLQGWITTRTVKAEATGEDPGLIAKTISTAMSMDTSGGILNCEEVFSIPEELKDDLEGLMVFFRDTDSGDKKTLQVIDNPFETT